ncbi:MAG: dipicolinate synthase subunit DpsA [Oscillospiraceae bacterium]|nr:dipicolinate synthase subunit DpsA [Oscillospiraceae bacterium]
MSTYLVAGGDLRNAHIANLLCVENNVRVIGFDDNSRFKKEIKVCLDPKELCGTIDRIVLPLPVSIDNYTVNTPLFNRKLTLEEVINTAPKIVFGGMISDKINSMCAGKGIPVVDYFVREELAVCNAVATAEGAIQIAMEELPFTIHETKCLITGYGRVARVLSKSLFGLGARVTVAARKLSDIAWAGVNSMTAIHISELGRHIKDFPLIINTVPAKIFDCAILSGADRDALIIDLASKPGGVNFEDAKKLNFKVIWALSLPGKVAPFTSGKIIYNTINNIVKELEVT